MWNLQGEPTFRMTNPKMPTRAEILEKAISLYMQRQIHAGLPAILPEEAELKEESVWEEARLQLMQDSVRAEVIEDLERTAASLKMKVVPEKLAERVESLGIVESRLRQERKRKKRLQEEVSSLEKSERDLRRKLERYPVPSPPHPDLVPPPVKEPTRRGEVVVSRDCYPIFSRLWNQIKKDAATLDAVKVVAGRTGYGNDLIMRSLASASTKNMMRTERLTDRLLSCECLSPESVGITPET